MINLKKTTVALKVLFIGSLFWLVYSTIGILWTVVSSPHARTMLLNSDTTWAVITSTMADIIMPIIFYIVIFLPATIIVDFIILFHSLVKKVYSKSNSTNI